MEFNHEMMSTAISCAKKAEGKTWTDPLVGIVLVKNGKIIARAYHEGYRAKHAFMCLLDKINPRFLNSADLYLTMEPCDECCDKMLEYNFNHIFIAQKNPRLSKPKDNLAKLAANFEVSLGLLGEEAKKLNPYYNYFYQNRRPWITIKQNLSLDHQVSQANGQYLKLTNPQVRDYIHHERANYQAIIIGSSTAIIDNPNLTANKTATFHPIRIIMDRRGRLLNNRGLNLLHNPNYETWILTQNQNVNNLDNHENIKVFQMQTDKLSELMSLLVDHGIQSAYVEGGPTLEKSFMDEGYATEIVDYIKPIYFGSIGIPGAVPVHKLALGKLDVQQIDDHVRIAGTVL